VVTQIEQALDGAGLANPRVTLREVAGLAREASGKLKRFTPLHQRLPTLS
jgi:hypothetical protein